MENAFEVVKKLIWKKKSQKQNEKLKKTIKVILEHKMNIKNKVYNAAINKN